jgi:hypothetical protein
LNSDQIRYIVNHKALPLEVKPNRAAMLASTALVQAYGAASPGNDRALQRQ